jgi:hypothetical protein
MPTIPYQHKKKEGTMPWGGCAEATPRHLTLRLDRGEPATNKRIFGKEEKERTDREGREKK